MANVEKATNREERRSRRNEAIRHGISRYVHNLDPRGKDAMWWSGAVVSAGFSGLSVATGGGSAWAKTAFVGGVSVGFYGGEKAVYAARKRNIEKKYDGEELATKMKNLQTRHENGALRVQRLLMGVSAGAVYGGVTGAAVEAGNTLINKSFELRFPTMNDVNKAVTDLGNTSVSDVVNVGANAVHQTGEVIVTGSHRLYTDVLTPVGHGISEAWQSPLVQGAVHDVVTFGTHVKDVAIDITTNQYLPSEGAKRFLNPVAAAIGGGLLTAGTLRLARRNRKKEQAA